MSKEEAKRRAEQFIEEQKRILEEYGDGVVKSKCKDAVTSVQAVFQQISSKSPVTARLHVKS